MPNHPNICAQVPPPEFTEEDWAADVLRNGKNF